MAARGKKWRAINIPPLRTKGSTNTLERTPLIARIDGTAFSCDWFNTVLVRNPWLIHLCESGQSPTLRMKLLCFRSSPGTPQLCTVYGMRGGEEGPSRAMPPATAQTDT